MDIKRRLINTLPEGAKRTLAVPYDLLQKTRANRRFAKKNLVERELPEEAPENIVVVVVDALRGDFVDEDLTPFLADLNGVRDAVAPASWTFPSVSSILTGVYPHEHGAIRQEDSADDTEGLTLPPRMDNDRETLTEVLAGAGYRTRGVFGHDTPFVALAGRFHDHKLYHTVNSNDDDVLEAYVDMVKDTDTKEFGYIHLAGPHIPVDPPEEYWEKHDVDRSIEGIKNWEYNQTVDCGEECQMYRENRRRIYRASVDYADDAMRNFYDEITDVFGDVSFFVTSDHGEAMWEHVKFDVENFGGTGCVDHGGTPYESVTRVPLLTDEDIGFGDGYVSLIDIAPTVLDEVGLKTAMETTGKTLLGGISNDRTLLVEGCMNGYEKKAVYEEGYKFVVSRGDRKEMGFTVPDERRVEVPEEIKESMLEYIPDWPGGGEGSAEVSAVVEDRLADLGYK
jgi:arylsulfatase A-like enzyme